MQQFPHHYSVTAAVQADSHVALSSTGLPDLESAPPAEFGGPGDRWSPETLLVAAVADCFVLSFKAIARASKFDWSALDCQVQGVLDREDRTTRFVRFEVRAVLEAPPDTDQGRARRLLEKAEQSCLITNSMTASVNLETELRVAGA